MRKLFLLLVISLSGTSCTTKKPDPVNSCAGALCTLEFRGFSIEVKHSNGNHAVLDNYYTVNINLNDTIYNGKTLLQGDSLYNVIDDNYTGKMYNKTYNFNFIGIINNTVVVNEPFVFSADCCHIDKVSGKSKVTID